jgi:hypothetical protein
LNKEYQHIHELRVFQDYLKSVAPKFLSTDFLSKQILKIRKIDKFNEIIHIYMYLSVNKNKKYDIDINYILKEIFLESSRILFINPYVMQNDFLKLQNICYEVINNILKKTVTNLLLKRKQEFNSNNSASKKNTINDFLA